MINGGDGSKVTSPNPSDFEKSDGGSQYSSCGESELERYCSANSAMGTPSMCSTITTYNDCFDSELFGSMRNLGLGDDSNLENFSLGDRFDRVQEDRRVFGSGTEGLGHSNIEFHQGRVGAVARTNIKSSGLELYDNDELDMSHEIVGLGFESTSGLVGVAELDDGLGKGECSEDDGEEGSIGWRESGESGGVTSSFENVSSKEAIGVEKIERDFFSDGVEGGSSARVVGEEDGGFIDRTNLQSGGREMEREEDGFSLRYEHSEGEDSIHNYGGDDESRDGFYSQRNMHYNWEAKAENENPLLMNSSVAFGSDDWDDFVQETKGRSVTSLTLDALQDQREQNLETERNLLNLNSVASVAFSSTGQTEQEQDMTDMPIGREQVRGDYVLAEDLNSYSMTPTGIPNMGEPDPTEDVRDIPVASYQVKGGDELTVHTKSSALIPSGFPDFREPKQEDVRDITVAKNQVRGAEELENSPKNLGSNEFQMELERLAEKVPLDLDLNRINTGMEREHRHVNAEEVSIDDSRVLENQELGNSKVKLDPYDVTINQLSSHSTVSSENVNEELFEDHKNMSSQSAFENKMTKILKNSPVSADLSEDHRAPLKTQNLELNEFYDEFVLEMEEILLDSGESPGGRFSQGNRIFQPQLSLPLRDGGSTASTSGTDDAYPLIQHPMRIDGIEVVGARQKKGDVSFSERLVGVKEYTVYKIRVWSGKDQWEVERRYRDFYTLYRRLNTLFADQGWILPSSWSSVEKESRKIFGNASPDVIAERSVLIQECLSSILHSKFSSSPPSALLWFLSPQDSFPSSPMSNIPVPQSTSFTRRADTEVISTLGKTISLIVEIRPYKSTKQMLDAQHYTCAGCHKHFDDGKTMMQDFVQSFGWGKPRLCEYTGQLYCSSCHTNETAVLPARVLHHWDFTQYPVSQLAKSYLDSIHDQPMLCVSAVNPFLFSKVPALLHVMGVRKKIVAMLPYVHCPFRRTINNGLGSRRYLLESNDFFALRDLIDLSKGPFAALPVMVETVSRKILEHVTEQCLICCDVGVPCSARQACDDPSALIFPFQEAEIERCRSCESVFHKPCFGKLTYCPCGVQLKVGERVGYGASSEVSGALDLLGRRSSSGLPTALLSGLFAKAKPEKVREHKDSDNVILMGSLPSTSL